MKQTKLIMGLPIIVEILDKEVTPEIFKKVFAYFRLVDKQFSPFKETSETSQINNKKIGKEKTSKEMQEIIALAEKTKRQTNGYYDVSYQNKFDPSGIVKGWAIKNASQIIEQAGFKNYFIDAGGDIQTGGYNKQKQQWRIGIRNPFAPDTVVKIVNLTNQGIATSGTYFRGNHIYNPTKNEKKNDIVSMTVIGPDVLEADRFATAAFAMGREGIYFIEKLSGFAGYMIDKNGIAIFTSTFDKYL